MTSESAHPQATSGTADAEQNFKLAARGRDHVERANRDFYNRFSFPPDPARFEYLADADLDRKLVDQSLGDWRHRTVPADARVWVPGCGAFQAITLALQLPGAQILGSDLAERSLERCETARADLGLARLSLRRESLLDAGYRERFDLISCVGVLHHLDDPEAGLAALARALHPRGILELMVYNRFHRIAAAACQRAVRMLAGDAGDPQTSLRIARQLLAEFPQEDRLGVYSIGHQDGSDAQFADSFLQPVEHSYTVETLTEMAERCGLMLLQYRTTSWDKRWATHLWNLQIRDPGLARDYWRLPDRERWSVTNLVRHEASPLLWFYFQRRDANRPRKSEREISEEFLRVVFRRVETEVAGFVAAGDGRYRPAAGLRAFPPKPAAEESRAILAEIDGKTPMAEVLARCGIEADLARVNRLRVELTTPAFPYLIATGAPEPEAPDLADGRAAISRRLAAAARKGVRSADPSGT